MKTSLNGSLLVPLWGKVCLCFTQLWSVLISNTCWTVTLGIRPDLVKKAPQETTPSSPKTSLLSFSVFHLGMFLLSLGCTWEETATGSGRSFACWQSRNLMPSNVKHVRLRQPDRAKEKTLGNSKKRALSLARCSDSQDKLSYRRTSSVLTREQLSSLRLPSHKRVWHGQVTTVKAELRPSPGAVQNMLNASQPTPPWKVDMTSHLFACWCHILRQSSTLRLSGIKQVLPRQFAPTSLPQKHCTNLGRGMANTCGTKPKP